MKLGVSPHRVREGQRAPVMNDDHSLISGPRAVTRVPADLLSRAQVRPSNVAGAVGHLGAFRGATDVERVTRSQPSMAVIAEVLL